MDKIVVKQAAGTVPVSIRPAMAISFNVNHRSAGILHGLFSWFCVIYFAVFARG
jgi:hypothetical protein